MSAWDDATVYSDGDRTWRSARGCALSITRGRPPIDDGPLPPSYRGSFDGPVPANAARFDGGRILAAIPVPTPRTPLAPSPSCSECRGAGTAKCGCCHGKGTFACINPNCVRAHNCGCDAGKVPCGTCADAALAAADVPDCVLVILGQCLDAKYMEPLETMKRDLRVWTMGSGYAPIAFDDGEARLVVMPRTSAEDVPHVVTVTP